MSKTGLLQDNKAKKYIINMGSSRCDWWITRGCPLFVPKNEIG